MISIVIINLCSCPLFVFSPKLLKKIPPLLYLNAREVAIEREKIELLGRHYVDGDDGSIQLDEWVIRMRTVGIFLTESRLMLFFFNLVSVFLTIILLKGTTVSARSLAMFLFAMLPYSIGSSLISIMYVGKRLNLTDHDFRVVFVDWWTPIREGMGAGLDRARHAMAVLLAAVTLYAVVFVSLVRNILQPHQRVHGIVDEESIEPSALDDISSDEFLFESPTLPLDGVVSPVNNQNELNVQRQKNGSEDYEDIPPCFGQDSQTRLKGSDEHEAEEQRNENVSDIGSVKLSADSEDYDVDEGSIVLTGLDCEIDRDSMTISDEDL